ncbi:MAG: acetyl-CoA carboxylase biotin carboxyl carrier protein [Fusobacteriaceae bacterium]
MNTTVTSANELMKILEKENLTEISYEENGIKILLKRNFKSEQNSLQVEKNISVKAPKAKKENFVEILSYGIGIFYPNKKNEESILIPGEIINEGDEIGYIVAMGIKNPVVSEFTGTIIEVLVEEGDIVDFTKPILKLKK